MSTALSSIEVRADSVETRQDFAAFVSELSRDVRVHRGEIENGSLDRYLEALAAWTEDLDGYFANRGEATPGQPSWRLMARMLLAARLYE